MRKWYQVDFPPETAVKTLGDRDESERYEAGKKDFSPCVLLSLSLLPSSLRSHTLPSRAPRRMYLIKQNPGDERKLEMCFDCSAFQYQLKEQDKPFDDHVFQTIFLNKKHQHLWSHKEIREDKISASASPSSSPSLDLLKSRLISILLLRSPHRLVASGAPLSLSSSSSHEPL